MTSAFAGSGIAPWWRGALAALVLGTGGCGPGASQPPASGDVTLENWRAHPRIAEIRAIYEEIQKAAAQGRGTRATRRFDYDSPACQSTYPIRATSLWRDEAGRPRSYAVEQTVSHHEMMRIERYYDAEGHVRFIFVDRVPGQTRIYIATEGAVIWSVSRNDGADAIDPHTRDDWETRPSTAAEAQAEFEGAADCPEVKEPRGDPR